MAVAVGGLPPPGVMADAALPCHRADYASNNAYRLGRASKDRTCGINARASERVRHRSAASVTPLAIPSPSSATVTTAVRMERTITHRRSA